MNKNFLHDLPLRTKMIWIFSILLILPSALFIIYSTNRIQNTMKEQTLISARKTFDESFLSLQSSLDKMNNVSDILAHDELMYRMYSTDPHSYALSQQFIDFRTLSASFKNLQSLSEVDHIRLYLNNDYIYSNNGINFFSFENLENDYWYERLHTNPSSHWFNPLDFYDQSEEEQHLFSFMRLLYNSNDYSMPAAVLRIDVTQAIFEQALSRTSVTPNSMLLLISENNVILSSQKEENQSLTDKIVSTFSQIRTDEWSTLTFNRTDYYAFCANLGTTDWQLLTVIPYSDINHVSTALSIEMLIIMICLSGISYTLALYMADSTLKRIWQLADTMQNVEKGATQIQFIDSGNDEIGQLIAHFTHMMNRINQLMDEKFQYGRNIKNLELKALQAQINPHFLYNTLDTINCFAIQKNIPEITCIVSSLATFYKTSLSNGKEYVSIFEEITHVKMYLQIMDIRYSNQLQIIWSVSPEIEHLPILKITLQPIIENAIVHGIFEKEDEKGTITVNGWREGDDIFISISDDGVGMTQKVLKSNFLSTSNSIRDSSGGYGIRNINDRLHIAYGMEYGLSCESIIGEGTTVTVHIPAGLSN